MLNRNYILRQSRLWFSMASNALSLFHSFLLFLCMHLLCVAYFLRRRFFLLLYSRLYLSFFVYFRYAILDSVHILSAFSNIIFPFAVLCFYCLLLLLFFTFFTLLLVSFFLGISFYLTILVRRIMCVFCYRRLTLGFFFFPFCTSCGMGNLYVNIHQSQMQSFHKSFFVISVQNVYILLQICAFQPPLTIHL